MRVLNVAVLLGLWVGWLLVRGSIWLSLDLFGWDFHTVITVTELLSIIVIAGVAFHFSMQANYRAICLLAAKYLTPMAGLFILLFGINLIH
ncbi:hypothetical protein J8M21_14635 [Pseudoalteromonas luteoviolacea]|uniref:hypothetical protein n=1 Tax=Pseudoalteromonas luteoviolacea TaxID=43657 RepID=UPI001B39DC2B|nr:hypothetical protein [Pseudoalteromonas luteoviolacea]MBQ4878447.1 hypothetical protein [Pseudoalteromonas luteoviolacea]MBQ4907602.1 hypothetical protein [Pseudoalteromonas luteoviolacea]